MIPPPRIERVKIGLRVIRVIRDDDLPGGTKQAALMDFLPSIDADEFVYASPRQGYAQIALAMACYEIGRRAVIFVPDSKESHERTKIAVSAGARVIRVPAGYLAVIQKRARDYAETIKRAHLIPFGVAVPEMVSAIARRARELEIEPADVWSVCGSGTLTRGLQEAWPGAKFYAVRVGSEPEAGRARVFDAPEKYQDDAGDPPPFPSCGNYDAKAWRFLKTFARNDSVFWNVAK